MLHLYPNPPKSEEKTLQEKVPDQPQKLSPDSEEGTGDPAQHQQNSGHKPKGQYTELVQEMCKAFMPTLNNIAKTLSAPETGLVKRVEDLEMFGVKVYNSVFMEKSGLGAHMDRMENALNNGPTALTNTVKDLTAICAKVDPMDERLKSVEGKVTQLEGDGLVTGASPLGLQEELCINKTKCDDLADKVDMTSNYLEVLFIDVAVIKKQVVVNAAKRMLNELVIGGIRLEEAEDLIDTTKCFLMNKLSIMFNSDDLVEASRSNNSTEKKIYNRIVNIPPVMFIKVTDKLRKQILSNTWRLANLKDDIDGFGYYVKQSMPEEYRAVHAKHQAQYNHIKEKNWDIPEGEPCSDAGMWKTISTLMGKCKKRTLSLPPRQNSVYVFRN